MAKGDAKTPATYVSPLPAGEEFEFVSAHTIFPELHIALNGTGNIYYQKVEFNGNFVWDNTYKIIATLGSPGYREEGINVGFKENLLSGTYTVYYSYEWSAPGGTGGKMQATYTFQVVENRLPLKDWTVTEGINRELELAETLRKGEVPRFRLNGMRRDGTIITEENKQEGEEVGQAALFDKILCPQLALTKGTLRENLNEFGKIIHGEVRLIPKKDEYGYYYEVKYDIYGSGKMSTISRHKDYSVSLHYPITSFCAALDSPTENLINTLDRFGGVVAEPSRNDYKTVRTENLYVRVSDSSMNIQTLYPIYSVSKLEYDYNGTPVDITAYLFEDSEYNRLSSFESQYPQSKLYALRFKQGERNIDGLNFKRQRTTDIATQFGDYSIVAILKEATGDSKLSITDYPTMQFRVTYVAIYNTRVSQTKPYFKDVKYKADLYFNQSANLVETKSYGENLKGVVARIGNADKAISYKLYRTCSIPKAGDMYDDEYMISGVAVSYMPTYIDCTIVLSKNFNRISPYIGVSSEKRYYEVSEKQAVECNVLYREYVVIGTEGTPDLDSRIGDGLMSMIADTFTQGGNYAPISCVAAWGSTYNGNGLPAVLLPVISSAFGNSLSFSWRYADNYSAGEVVNYANTTVDQNEVSGYFQNNYAYTDIYGRIYYYDFDLQTEGADLEGTKYPALPADKIPTNPSGYFSTVGQQPYILRKDSREALSVSVQVDFVTNVKEMIIGSALASYCAAVRGSDKTLGAKLYIFPDRLDKFIDHVEGSARVKLSDLPSQTISVSDVANGVFTVDSAAFTAGGKSWAIVTNQTTTAQEVENEKGEVFTQEEVTGGDVLIARNIEVTAGQAFEPVYFTKKREVFDKTVWKDRR